MIKLAVIIPVHNGLEFTRKCLANLDREREAGMAESFRVETVVVDDGSTDDTGPWIRKNYPEVHILKGDGNLWWSGGVNLGMGYAVDDLGCTHFLWWNNDIITGRDYFSNLFEILSNSDTKTILGSKIYQMQEPERLWSAGGYFDTRTGKKDMYGRGMIHDPYQEPLQVDWFPGMGTVFPRQVVETIGFCDARHFPQYHGDSDYTFRAKKTGFSLVMHPRLVLYNDTANTAKKHEDSFKQLIRSLKDIKSLYNFSIDRHFYRRHATSIFARKELVKKYSRYIGGFFKWKLLSVTGMRRK